MIVVPLEARGERLDRYLASSTTLSRSRIAALLEAGHVTCNGKAAKKSLELAGGEKLVVVVPPAEPQDVAAEDIALRIVFEDDDVAVIDKPAGLTVHPSDTQKSGTLVNALVGKLGSLSGIGGVLRPGIVHRLDKNTSGLIIVAKNDAAHQHLVKAFASRAVQKTYLAFVLGAPPEEGKWDKPIGRHPTDRKRFSTKSTSGKHALTLFTRVAQYEGAAKLSIDLKTGRTHQIRVHASDAGYPLIGDATYGNKRPKITFERQALHAHVLELQLPSGKKKKFTAPLPADLRALQKMLEAL